MAALHFLKLHNSLLSHTFLHSSCVISWRNSTMRWKKISCRSALGLSSQPSANETFQPGEPTVVVLVLLASHLQRILRISTRRLRIFASRVLGLNVAGPSHSRHRHKPRQASKTSSDALKPSGVGSIVNSGMTSRGQASLEATQGAVSRKAPNMLKLEGSDSKRSTSKTSGQTNG